MKECAPNELPSTGPEKNNRTNETTGERLSHFNNDPVQELARSLADRYHPQAAVLVVCGTAAAEGTTAAAATVCTVYG
jgi:hypothetical protein